MVDEEGGREGGREEGEERGREQGRERREGEERDGGEGGRRADGSRERGILVAHKIEDAVLARAQGVLAWVLAKQHRYEESLVCPLPPQAAYAHRHTCSGTHGAMPQDCYERAIQIHGGETAGRQGLELSKLKEGMGLVGTLYDPRHARCSTQSEDTVVQVHEQLEQLEAALERYEESLAIKEQASLMIVHVIVHVP
eukprot:2039378-Rhodomonas_salina.2